MSVDDEQGGRPDEEKRAVGWAALREVSSGMILGLGTGSTVRFFLEGLGAALKSGELQDIRGVPTSRDTEARCRSLGIPTTELSEGLELDLAVDGADEVSPGLDLVKGLGGALLREKIVVQASHRFVVVVDSNKEVDTLGERSPIPIEVAPFGWQHHLGFLRSLGGEPTPRVGADGSLFTTDNGNHLIDLGFTSIPAPAELEGHLQARAGVVETGLFLGMADRVLVGTASGILVRDRPGSRSGTGRSNE